jgi:hypothetical protein
MFLISVIFHLMFSDSNTAGVTETAESETVDGDDYFFWQYWGLNSRLQAC